jgi:hypothetical protein
LNELHILVHGYNDVLIDPESVHFGASSGAAPV